MPQTHGTDTSPSALVRILDTDGDGTGDTNANGDYSLAAEEFYIQPEDDQDIEITRLIVHIRDTKIIASSYGNINAGGLVNGVRIFSDTVGGDVYFDGGEPIHTSAEWARLCHDAEHKKWGPGDEFLSVRYSFFKFTTDHELVVGGLRLRGHLSERFVVRVNDDLQGLKEHTFTVQGIVHARGESYRNSNQ